MKIESFDKAFQLLEEELKKPKPGLKAQLKMVTDPRPGHKTYLEIGDSCLKAGVLILLYPWKNRLHLVLTKRTERVDHHQAQISLPGGQQEEGESFEQTALREACEELGITPHSIKTLGELTPLYVPPSNYCIYPVVAVMDGRPEFEPSAEEVAEVIEIPLDHLLDPQNIHKEMWAVRDRETEVPFFAYKGYKVWGATAMVLSEFVELMRMFY